jgi:hypothetical protein
MYVTHDSHESAKYLVIRVKTIIGKIMYRNFVEHQVFRAKNMQNMQLLIRMCGLADDIVTKI